MVNYTKLAMAELITISAKIGKPITVQMINMLEVIGVWARTTNGSFFVYNIGEYFTIKCFKKSQLTPKCFTGGVSEVEATIKNVYVWVTEQLLANAPPDNTVNPYHTIFRLPDMLAEWRHSNAPNRAGI